MNHIFVMFISSVLAGLLSTMNVFTNNISDIYISLNDIYMTLLMTGWMLLFMGIFTQNRKMIIFGILLVIPNFYAIRTQFMISQTQFLLGMIPHHSMAIFMSKHLMNKQNSIQQLLQNIISSQSTEITFMKNKLSS